MLFRLFTAKKKRFVKRRIDTRRKDERTFHLFAWLVSSFCPFPWRYFVVFFFFFFFLSFRMTLFFFFCFFCFFFFFVFYAWRLFAWRLFVFFRMASFRREMRTKWHKTATIVCFQKESFLNPVMPIGIF